MAGVVKICHQMIWVSLPNPDRKVRLGEGGSTEGGRLTENGELRLISSRVKISQMNTREKKEMVSLIIKKGN